MTMNGVPSDRSPVASTFTACGVVSRLAAFASCRKRFGMVG